MFRLDRVLEVRELDGVFERPAEFDSAAHVRRTLAAIPWGWEVEVLLAGGREAEGAGGGWSWVLSDLKTLLETGKRLAG